MGGSLQCRAKMLDLRGHRLDTVSQLRRTVPLQPRPTAVKQPQVGAGVSKAVRSAPVLNSRPRGGRSLSLLTSKSTSAVMQLRFWEERLKEWVSLSKHAAADGFSASPFRQVNGRDSTLTASPGQVSRGAPKLSSDLRGAFALLLPLGLAA